MILTAAIDALEASIGDARQVESAGMAKAHIDRLFGVVRKGREIASARRVTLTSESMMVPNPVAQRLSGGAVACYDMRSDRIWLGESMAGKSQQLTTQLEVIHEVGHAHHLENEELRALVEQNEADVGLTGDHPANVDELDAWLLGHVLRMHVEFQAHLTEELAAAAMKDRARAGAEGTSDPAALALNIRVATPRARVGLSYVAAREMLRTSLLSKQVQVGEWRVEDYLSAAEHHAEYGGPPPSLSDFDG